MNSETKFRFIKVCYFESFTQMHSTDPGVFLSPEKCLFPHVPPFLLHVHLFIQHDALSDAFSGA